MTDLAKGLLHNGHASVGREDQRLRVVSHRCNTNHSPCLNVSTSLLEIHCIALAEIFVPKLRSNGDGAPPFQKESTLRSYMYIGQNIHNTFVVEMKYFLHKKLIFGSKMCQNSWKIMIFNGHRSLDL